MSVESGGAHLVEYVTICSFSSRSRYLKKAFAQLLRLLQDVDEAQLSIDLTMQIVDLFSLIEIPLKFPSYLLVPFTPLAQGSILRDRFKEQVNIFFRSLSSSSNCIEDVHISMLLASPTGIKIPKDLLKIRQIS